VSIRRSVGQWIESRARAWLTHRCVVHGFNTVIVNTRADIDTKQVIARLDGALALLKQYVPHHYRRLSRDFSGFLVERRAYRGAFLTGPRTCLVELTFIVNPAFSLAQVAATILHEAMHARLHACGVAISPAESHRQERFCRRVEIEFGSIVPDGEPVVRRAMETLSLTDQQIAPVIDQRVAAQRVAEADLAAASMPMWLKAQIARQQGLEPPASGGGAA
jgi:hypothetical protein